MLGDVLGELGQFDEAVAMLRKATELDPGRVGAWHNLVMLKRISAADRSLVEQLEDMLRQADRTEFDRLMVHFALGKAYDDLGEYARAIGHFDEGKRMEHMRQPFDRDVLVAAVDQLIDTFTPEFFARHAALGNSERAAADDRRHASVRHDADRADRLGTSAGECRRRAAILE